jgi:hypothetical protein
MGVAREPGAVDQATFVRVTDALAAAFGAEPRVILRISTPLEAYVRIGPPEQSTGGVGGPASALAAVGCMHCSLARATLWLRGRSTPAADDLGRAGGVVRGVSSHVPGRHRRCGLERRGQWAAPCSAMRTPRGRRSSAARPALSRRSRHLVAYWRTRWGPTGSQSHSDRRVARRGSSSSGPTSPMLSSQHRRCGLVRDSHSAEPCSTMHRREPADHRPRTRPDERCGLPGAAATLGPTSVMLSPQHRRCGLVRSGRSAARCTGREAADQPRTIRAAMRAGN